MTLDRNLDMAAALPAGVRAHLHRLPPRPAVWTQGSEQDRLIDVKYVKFVASA